MKRPLKPDEAWVWGVVAATVHPLPGKRAPEIPDGTPPRHPGRLAGSIRDPEPAPTGSRLSAGAPAGMTVKGGEKGIEPRRKHRIAKERDPIGARIDLHGMDQDRARAALEAFLRRAWDEGYRAVLVITGKGVQGDGVLRRRTPEWLAAPALVPIVAGISEAHRKHGGEGALYVALKRKPRG
jgi:DNA-nicking Smr family endonuclease